MMRSLPIGLASGMVIQTIDQERCRAVLKDRFWIRNPFGSVFWAVMSMAAELTTGALLYTWCSGNGVKFILVGVQATFHKKLRGKSFYSCHSGLEVQRMIEAMVNTGDQQMITMPVVAQNADGITVADFQFTWSMILEGKK